MTTPNPHREAEVLPIAQSVAEAYEHAARVADYAVERAERDWRNPDKQDAVKQVGAEIAEVIREYARAALAKARGESA